MTEIPLTPSLRHAMALLYDALAVLQLETRDMDREARHKYISNRIAQRHYERQGKSPIDTPRSVAMVSAECLMLVAIGFDGT